MTIMIEKVIKLVILIISITKVFTSTTTILKNSAPYRKNCQCLYYTGTQGHSWGRFNVTSKDEKRFNDTECLLIFITGTEEEIVELRFEEIILRKKCLDQIHIFPHLREPVIQESYQPEDTICHENIYQFLSSDTYNITTNYIDTNYNNNEQIIKRNNFRINDRHALFSSERILGIRLIYGHIHLTPNQSFNLIGKFHFIDKVMFKNDGNLVPTTFCDYQFLPRPINYAKENNYTDTWRYFHSPRYPAKYPNHIKCSYKFVGRPRNRVEVIFEEIYLLTGHSSCLQHTDKLVIYDGKFTDKSSIIDVLCNVKPTRKFISTGSNFLIEFEASSNRTSYGFSAKYRFIDVIIDKDRKLSLNLDSVRTSIPNHAQQNGSPQFALKVLSNTTIRSVNDFELNSNASKIFLENTTNSNTENDSIMIYNNNSSLNIEIESKTNTTVENINLLKHENHTIIPFINPKTLRTLDMVSTTTITIKTLPSDLENPLSNTENMENNSTIHLCPPGTNCDIVLHSSKAKNGTFISPLFPNSYPVRTFCRIEFQGQGRERVQINFIEFSLPSDGDSYNCQDSDNLQILIPIRNRYEPIETLCGDIMPKPIMSDGTRMLLEFRGRKSGKGNRGFKGEYRFVENYGIITGRQSSNGDCTFKFNGTETRNGFFHSPNFPGAYPRNIECNYLFYGDSDDKISIRFTYFDVEGIEPCNEESASDYVEFSNFMSIDRKYRKWCGKQDSFSLESDGRFFRITFRSNDRFDKTGFRASYHFIAIPATTERPRVTPVLSKSEIISNKLA